MYDERTDVSASIDGGPPPRHDDGRRPRERGAGSASLTGVFVLLLLYALHVAAPVFVPVAVALLLSLLLGAPLRLLRRMRIPVPVAAAVVVALFVGILGSTFYALSSPAAEWMEQVPRNLKKLERKLAVVKAPIQEVSDATQQVEELTSLDGSGSGATRAVEIKEPGFLRLTLRSTPPALVSIAVTFVLLYFMLVSGREIMRKIASAANARWTRGEMIGIVREVEAEISRYLITVSAINAGLGACTALALYAQGVPNAVLWGVAVGVLNYAPYVGATLSTALLTVVGLLAFDSIGRALLVPAVFVALAFIEGQFVTPAIVGRRLSMSPLIVFLSVVVSGWMWGVIGALIAVPLLACTKVVCQHVPQWARVAQIIGR